MQTPKDRLWGRCVFHWDSLVIFNILGHKSFFSHWGGWGGGDLYRVCRHYLSDHFNET